MQLSKTYNTIPDNFRFIYMYLIGREYGLQLPNMGFIGLERKTYSKFKGEIRKLAVRRVQREDLIKNQSKVMVDYRNQFTGNTQ